MFRYSQYGHTVQLVVPSNLSKLGRRSFSVAGPRFLNLLPQNVRYSNTIEIFKNGLKTYLFDLSDYEIDKLWIQFSFT